MSGPGEHVTAVRAVPSNAERVSRFGTWYVAEHWLRSMRSYGWTIVVGGVGQPLLYLLGIGMGLAAFLDRPVASGPHGPVSYLWFVAPALVVTSAVGNALDEFTYSIMQGFRWRRLFWAMTATPLQPGQVAAGVVVAVVGRMLFTTVAYTGLALLFGGVGNLWAAPLMPVLGVLAGLAFGLPLMAYSATLTDDRGQLSIVQRFVFTPLFLFSGTFFPLSSVPAWLHPIGWVSPVWHAAEVARAASYGQVDGWPVWAHLAVLVAMAAGGWALARRTFWRRLRG